MKKLLLTVSIAIVVICLLTIPPLLQPLIPYSQGTPQPTPSSTPQATPQSTIQPTPQSTPQPTPTSTTQPQPTPQNTPQPTQQTTMPPSNRTLQEAIGNATSFLDKSNEPYAMLMLNVIYRRFGIDEFADSLQLYDAALANSSGTNASLLRVFRRIASYGNALQAGDLMAVDAETDRVTVPALYCDGLDAYYFTLLTQAANGKDYLLTHALLATIWIQENHYQMPLPSSSIEKLFQDNADLIDNDPVITDLELEAATFLYMAGQGSMVNDVFIQNVIDAQNVDGGWRFANTILSNNMILDSNWHTTVLGLLLLLHIQNPADSYPPMLAPAPN